MHNSSVRFVVVWFLFRFHWLHSFVFSLDMIFCIDFELVLDRTVFSPIVLLSLLVLYCGSDVSLALGQAPRPGWGVLRFNLRHNA